MSYVIITQDEMKKEIEGIISERINQLDDLFEKRNKLMFLISTRDFGRIASKDENAYLYTIFINHCEIWTVCLLKDRNSKLYSRGIAIKSKTDIHDAQFAAGLAYKRARSALKAGKNLYPIKFDGGNLKKPSKLDFEFLKELNKVYFIFTGAKTNILIDSPFKYQLVKNILTIKKPCKAQIKPKLTIYEKTLLDGCAKR